MSLLALLFFFAAAHADDLFRPPEPALAKTKYANNCGGDFPDLRPEMPPVDAQGRAGWCSTFTARALLEHFYHRGRGETNDRFSVMDLNSLDSRRPPEQYGRVPELNPDLGASSYFLLEGVQKQGQLYRDADYRYDQRFWDRTGRIDRLSAYYDRQKPYAGDPQLLACRDQGPEVVGVESQFTGIENLLATLTKGEFLSAAGEKYQILPAPQKGAVRETLQAAFNVRSLVPRTGDEYLEELRRNLGEHRPTSVAVCANQLRQLPGLGRGAPLTPKDKTLCGGHALVVVGLKTINGQCQVEVRNSWGAGWPKPAAGGYAWIPVKDFLRVQQLQGDLVSLVPRAEGAPPQNRFNYLSPFGVAEGATWQMQLVGKGKSVTAASTQEGIFSHNFLVYGQRVDRTGDTYSGKFENGLLVDGTFSKKDGPTFTGKFTGGILVEGTRTEADGSFYTGRFSHGALFNGKMKGRLTSGALYEGEYQNGALTGRGKIVDVDGTTFEGTLVAGRYQDGYFKGLLNAQKGIYYEGSFKGGSTQPDGKFTDKNGHPWVWQ